MTSSRTWFKPEPDPPIGIEAQLRGAWEDLCAVCEHRYGDHYVTFDRDNAGCTGTDPRDKLAACACQGFTQ